jgi:hypothetical protein
MKYCLTIKQNLITIRIAFSGETVQTHFTAPKTNLITNMQSTKIIEIQRTKGFQINLIIIKKPKNTIVKRNNKKNRIIIIKIVDPISMKVHKNIVHSAILTKHMVNKDLENSFVEATKTFKVNLISTIKIKDHIKIENPKPRIRNKHKN